MPCAAGTHLGCAARKESRPTASWTIPPSSARPRASPGSCSSPSSLVAVFGSAGAVFGLVQWLRRDLPDARAGRRHPAARSRRTVYDVRGRVLHEFYKENRSPVPLKADPAQPGQRHAVDRGPQLLPALGRRPVGHRPRRGHQRRCTGARAQGGSTITQQLARNLFLTHERTLDAQAQGGRARDRARAQLLEGPDPRDVLQPDLLRRGRLRRRGRGARPSSASRSQRAHAARVRAARRACPANPSLYSPRRQPAGRAGPPRARCCATCWRRARSPRSSSTTPCARRSGVTADALRATTAPPTSSRWCACTSTRSTARTPSTRAASSVYTTLDIDLQQIAERALEKPARRARGANSSSSNTRAGVRPAAGRRRAPRRPHALPAGRASSRSTRAPATCARWSAAATGTTATSTAPTQAQRQPGSAFKPFVYTAAMDNGFKPTDIIVDAPVSLPRRRRQALPAAATTTSKFRGPVTLRYALQQSINIPAIKLLRKVGTSLVGELRAAHGHQEPDRPEPVARAGHQRGEPARADVRLRACSPTGASATSRSSSSRSRTRPATCSRRNAPRPVEVLSEETAAVMTSHAAERHGPRHRLPGARARLHAPGRRQDRHHGRLHGRLVRGLHRRAWSCGVWVGFDDEEADRPGHDRRARRAADLDRLHDRLRRAAGRSRTSRCRPARSTRKVCAETGMLATDACPNVTTEIFHEGSEPTEYCTTHPGLPLPADRARRRQPPRADGRCGRLDRPEPQRGPRAHPTRERRRAGQPRARARWRRTSSADTLEDAAAAPAAARRRSGSSRGALDERGVAAPPGAAPPAARPAATRSPGPLRSTTIPTRGSIASSLARRPPPMRHDQLADGEAVDRGQHAVPGARATIDDHGRRGSRSGLLHRARVAALRLDHLDERSHAAPESSSAGARARARREVRRPTRERAASRPRARASARARRPGRRRAALDDSRTSSALPHAAPSGWLMSVTSADAPGAQRARRRDQALAPARARARASS